MTPKSKKLNQLGIISIKLSKAIGKIIDKTKESDLPLRLNDIAERLEIKEICKHHKYDSLSKLLKEIIYHKYDDMIPYMRYENRGIFTHWYFERTKHIYDDLDILEFPSFKIETHVAINPIFSVKEMNFLLDHRESLELLINGAKKPRTEAQTNLTRIANDLVDNRKEKTVPKTFYEKVIAKYILVEKYNLTYS